MKKPSDLSDHTFQQDVLAAAARSTVSGKLGLFGALHELAEVEIEIEPVLAELRPNQLLFFGAPELLAANLI